MPAATPKEPGPTSSHCKPTKNFSRSSAVDAALAASERAESEKAALTSCDDRATVIDLLSQCNKENVQAPKKHETDQIFILGYN